MIILKLLSEEIFDIQPDQDNRRRSESEELDVRGVSEIFTVPEVLGEGPKTSLIKAT